MLLSIFLPPPPPFSFFSWPLTPSYSTLFLRQSPSSPSLSPTVKCEAVAWMEGWLLFVVIPLFHPFASALKHPPLFLGSVLLLSTGEFSRTLPPLSLVYRPPPPPPHLPACCFPREVNLLSAGSMNSTGLELRPTHLPDIAHVLCIAPACRISQAPFPLLLGCCSAPSFQNTCDSRHCFRIM